MCRNCASYRPERRIAQLFGCAMLLLSWATMARADEVCRFSGTTDYHGRLEVTTEAAEKDGQLRLDVLAQFWARSMLFAHIHYLSEEVSTWRDGVLDSVAVNNRYLFNGGIVRQQWDVFERRPDGLDGHRVQGKRLAEFSRQHPGFVQHWDPQAFGSPWLRDYGRAASDNRPDLGLDHAQLLPGLRAPLAFAFYWVRRLPSGAWDLPVFLPGFKGERLVNVPIRASRWPGGMLVQATLRYHALATAPASTASAWLSTDGHLLQLAFEVHGLQRSGRGIIKAEGCVGEATAR